MKMDVCDVRPVTDSVHLYTLRHPRRSHLPAPIPGAHVDLHLPDGRIRQYSLCGDPDDDTVYQIAVKREDDGRGASRWIHENLRVGCMIPTSAPRNNFPLAGAARHVFIAGGIGITPILPMIRHLSRRNVPFELHYRPVRCLENTIESSPRLRHALLDECTYFIWHCKLLERFLGHRLLLEPRQGKCQSIVAVCDLPSFYGVERFLDCSSEQL